MFEACAAAASVLLDGPHTGTAALQGVTIADPLLMPVQASLVLEADVSLRDGSVQLCSIAPGRSARRATTKLHCTGMYAAVHQPLLPAAASKVAEQQASAASGSIRRLVAAAVENAGGSVQQSAVAAIWAPSSAQQNGYCMQPARSDAVLHLSGAFNRQAAPLQIPVAMSALVIQSAGSHSCWVHPTATRAAAGSGSGSAGHVSLGFRLHGQQAQPLFQLAGLLVKEVGAVAAAAPAVAAAVQPAAAEAPAEFMYSIDWQVEQQQAQAVAGSRQAAAALVQCKGAWSVAGDSSVSVHYSATTSASTAGVVAAAADGLELLQRRLSQMTAGSLSLQVGTAPSVLPSSGASCATAPAAAAAAASLGALIKVAGMEFAAVSMHSSRADAATPAAAQAAAADAMDAIGTASAGGALLRAKLLRQPVAVMPPNNHLMPLPRGSLAGIKLAPHTQASPGPGEIKVSWRWASNEAHQEPACVTALPTCLKVSLLGGHLPHLPQHLASLLMLSAHPPAGVRAGCGAQLPRCAQRAGHVPWRPRPARRRLLRRGGGCRRGGGRPGPW
jgi:hypothetical protein